MPLLHTNICHVIYERGITLCPIYYILCYVDGLAILLNRSTRADVDQCVRVYVRVCVDHVGHHKREVRMTFLVFFLFSRLFSFFLFSFINLLPFHRTVSKSHISIEHFQARLSRTILRYRFTPRLLRRRRPRRRRSRRSIMVIQLNRYQFVPFNDIPYLLGSLCFVTFSSWHTVVFNSLSNDNTILDPTSFCRTTRREANSDDEPSQ